MSNHDFNKPSTPRMTREEYLKLSMKERAALPAAVIGSLMVASMVENLNEQTKEQPDNMASATRTTKDKESSLVETPVPQVSKPTDESSETTKPASRIVDVTDQAIKEGRAYAIFGLPKYW